MKREIWLWAAFFAIVIAAGLYWRFFYQQSIGISVKIAQLPLGFTAFPFQKLSLPILVNNTGTSTIKGMSVGIYVDGNLTRVFTVTLPPGKEGVIPFNYTPASAGVLNITAIADSAKLYDIQNRGASFYTEDIIIHNSSAPDAYSLLPSGGGLGNLYTGTTGSYGSGAAGYLYNTFGVRQLSISNLNALNSFIYPLIYQLSQYTPMFETSYAWGSYPTYTLFSIWLKGYFNQTVIQSAATGSGILYKNMVWDNNNVTLINFSNGTSLCTWYSGGWTKILAANGTLGCKQGLNQTVSGTLNASQVDSGLVLEKYIHLPVNTTPLGNFTGFYGQSDYFGTLYRMNDTIYYESVVSNGIGVGSNVCYGVIAIVNNTYYCESYILPESGQQQSLSLVKLNSYIDGYNISIFSLANTTETLQTLTTQNPADSIDMAILRNVNITGKSLQLVSAEQSTCSFGGSWNCSDVNLANGNLSFNLTNDYDYSVDINAISCNTNITVSDFYSTNVIIPSNSMKEVNVQCYQNGNVISGVPLGLNLFMLMKYTANGIVNSTVGKAYLVS